MPERLGPYIIEGELGRGGMGVVYRARHESLDRVVALKVIGGAAGSSITTAETMADGTRAEASSRDLMLLARFKREAQAAGRLAGHPGIVGVHDVGVHPAQGTLYLAMELVEGRTLDAVIQEGDLGTAEAARLFVRIAQAVHHAHQQGVLHRDLKPANVLVTHDGVPKVTDFGLAKSRDVSPEVTQLTHAGELIGTPAYMAPEQARGAGIDARADVYALGVSLFETLAGRVPFDGDSLYRVVAQVVRDDPPPLRSLAPHVPAALEAIVDTCLQKSPERRYATAADFAADLERFLRGEPVRARRRSALARWWGGRGRWAAAAVVVAGVAGGTVWWLYARDAASSTSGREAIDDTQRARTHAEQATLLSSAWLAMSQRAMAPMRALQDHFYGRPGSASHVATQLDAIRAASESVAALAVPTPAGWVALGEVYARRDGAWDRLAGLGAADAEDPLLQVLIAHAALARYADELEMPHAEFTAGGSVMAGYTEQPAMAQWRSRAKVALDRAATSPLWPLLTQSGAIEAYAAAGRSMARGDFAQAAAELAPLADEPLFGDEAAALSAFAHLYGDNPTAAALGWERVGRRGWSGALSRAALARIFVATRAAAAGGDAMAELRHGLASARTAAHARPDDPRMRSQVGMLHWALALQHIQAGSDPMGDLEAALHQFERAAAAGPVGVDLFLNMSGARRTWAQLRAKQGIDPRPELRIALADLSQGLSFDPEWLSARRVLGDIWVLLARFEMDFGGDPYPAFEQARAAMQVVLDTTPTEFAALVGLSNVWRAQADTEAMMRRPREASVQQGLDAIQRALQVRPRDTDALSNAGLLWRELGECRLEAGADPTAPLGRALACLDLALAIEPGHFGRLNNRALVHRSLGDQVWRRGGGDPAPHFRAAIADLEAAMQARPAELIPRYNRAVNRGFLAAVLAERGDPVGDLNALILEDFDTVIAGNPSLWQALMARGHHHRRAGRGGLALADYQAALTVNPRLPEATEWVRRLEQGR